MKKQYTEEEQREREEKAETLQAIRETARRRKNAIPFIDVCREVKNTQQCKRSKGYLVDHFSACAVIAVYDALKREDLKKQLFDIAESNPLRAIDICFKLCR